MSDLYDGFNVISFRISPQILKEKLVIYKVNHQQYAVI